MGWNRLAARDMRIIVHTRTHTHTSTVKRRGAMRVRYSASARVRTGLGILFANCECTRACAKSPRRRARTGEQIATQHKHTRRDVRPSSVVLQRDALDEYCAVWRSQQFARGACASQHVCVRVCVCVLVFECKRVKVFRVSRSRRVHACVWTGRAPIACLCARVRDVSI